MSRQISWLPGIVPSDTARAKPRPLAAEASNHFGTPLVQVPMQPFPIQVAPRRSSLGAAGVVNVFGQVGCNPIGAGIPVRFRPQSSYGPAAEFIAGAIWWHNQSIPTSVPHSPLTTPDVLLQLLGPVNVQAAARAQWNGY